MIPIANIQHFSLSDFPGTPSCIIFTQGCNLSCKYCHNRQLIPFKESDHYFFSKHNDVMVFLKERAGKLPGVVFTGGEPLVHGLDAIHFIEEVKKLGFKVKLDTNGTFPHILQWILERDLVDYVALDIKAPWDKYDKITKIEAYTVDSVKASLDLLKKSGISFETRITYDKSILTIEDLSTVSKYAPLAALHRINECKTVKTVF